MSETEHPRSFFSLPRDYLQRRRVLRRFSNFILISLLSGIVGYVIARPTGGPGYALPKARQASSGVTVASDPKAPAPEAAASLAASAGAGSAPPGGYKVEDGAHTVRQIEDIVLHDAKRNKDLHVRVFYPSDPGAFPVIVFSHGAGGSQNCCEALTRHWSSYGYVTLQPTHEDSTSLRRNSGEDELNFLKAVRDALKRPDLWESRALDISFLLDSLPALEKQAPVLEGKMDAQRIGVGGHSMGAFTADAIAGALVDLPGRPRTNFSDSRVKAVVLLSPQGPGEFGLTSRSWEHVTVPLLSMTGSLDRGANRQGPDWKKIPFDRSQPGDKYHLFVDGANHMSFIGARTVPPVRSSQGEAILGYTNSAALAFWDAYLRGDSGAKKYLQSDALPQSSHGVAKLYRR